MDFCASMKKRRILFGDSLSLDEAETKDGEGAKEKLIHFSISAIPRKNDDDEHTAETLQMGLDLII